MSFEEVLDNKLIVFKVSGEEYAIPVSYVGGIERILPITRVPSVASYIKGVINLRGIVTPVIDLKERFFQQETELTEQSRIIIVHLEEMSVGLIVEAANDVVDIQVDQIEPAPDVVGSANVDYIKGVIKMEKHLYILLDLEKVLSKEYLSDIKAMEG